MEELKKLLTEIEKTKKFDFYIDDKLETFITPDFDQLNFKYYNLRKDLISKLKYISMIEKPEVFQGIKKEIEISLEVLDKSIEFGIILNANSAKPIKIEPDILEKIIEPKRVLLNELLTYINNNLNLNESLELEFVEDQQKVLFLHKLGVIEYLRKSQNGISENKIGEILHPIINVRQDTIRKCIERIRNDSLNPKVTEAVLNTITQLKIKPID
jgi:hypothetical protein